RPLELTGILEVGELSLEILPAQVIVQLLADEPVHRQLRILLQEPDERVGRADGGVPVAAAVERAGLVVTVYRFVRRLPEIGAAGRPRLQLVEAAERHRRVEERGVGIERGNRRGGQRLEERVEVLEFRRRCYGGL